MLDLLGDALLLERKNAKPEANALKEVLIALAAHSTVAWCERMNSGAAKIGNRFVRSLSLRGKRSKHARVITVIRYHVITLRVQLCGAAI